MFSIEPYFLHHQTALAALTAFIAIGFVALYIEDMRIAK